jgi:nucleoside-diphosphate-sugar epimerase
VNIDGSRNVFEEAVAASVERICYASSVAAYGFHDDNPNWLHEEVPPRGSDAHFYSAQKAEVEGVLGQSLVKSTRTKPWIFRPCIVAGPTAQTMIEEIPYVRMSQAMPDPVRRLLSGMPVLKPVIPDPGIPFQLVHEDDVAQAFVHGVHGKGEPGAYNLAGNGKLTMSDLADALGWYSIPIPELAVDATAEVVARLPAKPPVLSWIESVRKPVLMKTDKAKKRLGWNPKYTSKATLKELVAAYRDEQRF